jgi:uncharacterized protein YbjQ (UPF0145 family)
MILSTTSTVEGRAVERYLGVVFGDAVLGVNVFKDLLGSLRDMVGGRSGTYERELGAARDTAMQGLLAQARSLGADAVIGIDIDYEVLGQNTDEFEQPFSGSGAIFLRRMGDRAAKSGARRWEPRRAAYDGRSSSAAPVRTRRGPFGCQPPARRPYAASPSAARRRSASRVAPRL